jgi:Ala-tRNA(Pro) deacylase
LTTLQKVIEYLDGANAPYTHTGHPVAYTARDVAAAEHLPPHEVAKTIIFFCDQGYGMAVVPADCVVDLEELRKTTGASNVRLATEAEIGALFPDSELGAMPPLGTLFGLPVILDEGLETEQRIAFNAGTHRDVIHMNLADYTALVEPKMAPIGRAVAVAH